jgi:hypothetical protein
MCAPDACLALTLNRFLNIFSAENESSLLDAAKNEKYKKKKNNAAYYFLEQRLTYTAEVPY